MPNGGNRNWIRLCTAVGGFHKLHGHWPTRIRVFPGIVADLRDHLFSPEAFARLTARIQLIEDVEGSCMAEDEEGRFYNSGATGDLGEARKAHVKSWLGVAPDLPYRLD